MNIGARVGTESDLRDLAELYRACWEALAVERGGSVQMRKEAFSEPLEAHFGAMVHDERRLVLLGTIDEVAVGLAVARLEELSGGSRLSTVEVLYVDPPARDVGVGEKLLGAVTEWAAGHGSTGIDVPVLPGMRTAKNFLEGSGFAARLLVMHHPLK